MTAQQWMLYGANGYTGALLAREAVRRGLAPVLAGRDRVKVEALAAELGLRALAFGLEDAAAAAQHVDGHALVLNCAGPFSATAAPMIEACLQARAHYLDITGEIGVFEHAQSLRARASETGVVVCPGVGFDVIPTDCVAAALKAALPDATQLSLGFDTRSGLSAGTAKTSVEGLAHGGKLRRGGRLVSVPLAYGVRRIDFGDGVKTAVTIPWGDVSTAFHTTGIPDVEVYAAGSPRQVRLMRVINVLRPVLGFKPLQRFLQARIARTVRGPTAAQREATPSFVWGEARNARGDVVTARIRTANGYSLTVTGALAMVEQVLNHPVPGGAYTPARLAGWELVTRLPGSGEMVIERSERQQ